MISPVDIIVELRRNAILELSQSPEEWNSMFNAIENNGAPWAFSPDDRDKWIAEADL
jgi:Fe-S oxidoreductase